MDSTDPKTEHRPWGSYTILDERPGYKVKRMAVKPGNRLSLQLHYKRTEHWVIVAGTARVTCGDEIVELTVGQSIDIPRETKHRIENSGTHMLEFVEVQHGTYFGEDDIVRLDDDYGRIAAP